MTQISTYNPLPAPGDILWCKYPESLGEPGPKCRPALVLAVAPTTHEVLVAYGTSQRVERLYSGEFLLSPEDGGFSASGLGMATKFNLAERVKLPFNSEWFAPSPGLDTLLPLPKMGALHSCYYQAAKKAQRQVT